MPWAVLPRGCWHSPRGVGAGRGLPGCSWGRGLSAALASLTVGHGCPEDILSPTSKISQEGARAEIGQKGTCRSAGTFVVNAQEIFERNE